MLNQAVIDQLRHIALHGGGIEEMVDFIQYELGLPLTQGVIPIAYLFNAFSLHLKDAMEVGLRSRFNAGIYPIEEIDRKVLPLILDNKENWEKGVVQEEKAKSR